MGKTKIYIVMKLTRSELQKRIEKLDEHLNCCKLCGFECGAKRNQGKLGRCGASSDVYISTIGKHYGEGPKLAGPYGAGTIFFSHCNASCVFCQNHQLSHDGLGEKVTIEKLARIMLVLEKNGCVNIDLISPTHYVPQIVRAYAMALDDGLTIPLLYNTNSYDSIEVIKLLDGIVDLYIPDIKMYSSEPAKKYCGLITYGELARKNIEEMFSQVGTLKFDERGIAKRGILARHLVMPAMVEQAKSVLDFIYELSPETHVAVMCQYNPTFRAHEFEEINRPLNIREYMEIKAYVVKKGFKNASLVGFGDHKFCNPDYAKDQPFEKLIFDTVNAEVL